MRRDRHFQNTMVPNKLIWVGKIENMEMDLLHIETGHQGFENIQHQEYCQSIH